jgi:hypothetical protein
MKKHEKEQALAILAIVLVLLVAACGAAPTPPPTPAPSQPTPAPTQAQASEVPVGVEEDLLGTWQVEGTVGDPVLLLFDKGRRFSIFAGSKTLDHGFFAIKDKRLAFNTDFETCRVCKGSYEAYIAQQEGQPTRLRFVLSGQDAYAARASALNGKTVVPMSGVLPDEVPVSTAEDVTGIWQGQAVSSSGPIWLTCDNGRYRFHIKTEVLDAGAIVVKDGILVFNTSVPGTPNGSYTVFVKRQSGQPVWLRFISVDDTDLAREQDLTGNIWRLQVALQPGEVPLGALDEVVGTWTTQTTDAPTQVIFENNGHFQTHVGSGFADRGSVFIAAGRLTFRSAMPDSKASGGYLVYIKKQASQATQLRFVLMSEENPDRGAYFDQKIYQPLK